MGFDDLPEDGFTPDEEKMREALFDFIERWRDGTPSLSDAGADEGIKRARMALLPKELGISLKDWIERRVGGEIDTLRADDSGQTFIGFAGQLGDIDDISKRSSKRKHK